ncbi:peptidase domain-containing ABC transporter [Flavihumibacter petaseus]|uniref:Putative ABC transporter permease/ATP-binding protein n=1 Tax=Flavihumibacter petaseus NBRC 106054 TaxID=1220578 RepID=A0A0E9MVY3_9BACT|nr:peptidase domain-containing ABC transporter [Flavihumibacter petaseus]GAO41290.1 putative ABC transporter permease/ATP-binding protein [Flavihumibacter petaseus NBRC 106054]
MWWSKPVRQQDATDCGPACLAYVMRRLGLRMPLTTLRIAAGTDKSGTSLWGLVQAAASFGVEASAIRMSYDQLSSFSIPIIAHIRYTNGQFHYVCVKKCTPDFLEIMDPAAGKHSKLPVGDFMKQWTGIAIVFKKQENSPSILVPGNKTGQASVIMRLWPLIQWQKSLLVKVVLGAALYSLLTCTMAIYLQQVVDEVLNQANPDTLNTMVIIMIAVLLLQGFIGISRDMLVLLSGQQIDHQLVMSYINHLFRLPLTVTEAYSSGEISSRVGDAMKIRMLVSDAGVGILLQLMIAICTMTIMGFYHVRLMLMVFATLPVLLLLCWLIHRYNRNAFRMILEAAAKVEAAIVESIQLMPMVKKMSIEPGMVSRFENYWITFMAGMRRSVINNSLLNQASEFFMKGITVTLLWYCGGAVIDHKLTAGELISFYTLLGYFSSALLTILASGRSIQEGLAAADRLFGMIALKPEVIADRCNLTFGKRYFGGISFDDVSFRYPNGFMALKNISFTISAGKLIALTGSSGSGKSTIAALLQRHLEPQSGSISAGGFGFNNFSLYSIRKQICWLSQDQQAITGTVWENICLHNDSPDWERMLKVCQETGIDELVTRLPDQYNTQLKERSGQFSAGQWQRLYLARALYREPLLLILDEATAHLDATAETEMLNMLRAYCTGGMTILLITHHRHLLEICDEVLAMEDGCLKSTAALDRPVLG